MPPNSWSPPRASLRALALDAGLDATGDAEVRGITHDSRRVRPGDLFVALPGTRQDGATYVDEAAARGAVAAVVAPAARDRAMRAGLPLVTADDPRLAFARLAAALHGHPARCLRLVGITGTLGKTSTALLVQQALAASPEGERVGIGVVGSLGAKVLGPAAARVPEGALPDLDGMTTPDPQMLHRAFRTMVDAGVRTVVMEVTSHALAQHRVAGLEYALGVFTNFVPDEHLDFHGSPDHYRRTKARFFDTLAPGAPLVANGDDHHVREMVGEALERAARPVVWVSLGALPGMPPADGESRDASVCVEDLHWGTRGSRFVLDVLRALPCIGHECGTVEAGRIPVTLPVLGVQQVANTALAATAALVAGATPEGVGAALSGLQPMFRRMQIVREAAPVVMDDTAGHPETLRAVFASLGPFRRSGLRVVFGLRGMRGEDINRRLAAMLGALVAEAASREPVRLIVTSSDDMADARNRTLPAEREAAVGALEASGARYTFVAAQREAIAQLLEGVRDDELVLVLGPQGMDHASELVREMLATRDATRAVPA